MEKDHGRARAALEDMNPFLEKGNVKAMELHGRGLTA
jgi:hypothetical protein